MEESCLYTSTAFFIWLRWLRTLHLSMTALSLIFGAVAGWKTLAGQEDMRAVVAGCAFLAGLLPTLSAALKIDKSINEAARLAAAFKNLQDRFRQAALVSSNKTFEQFEADVKPLMKRLEEARGPSPTPPEPIFWLAQKKVKAGHYTFDVDESGDDTKAVEGDTQRHPVPVDKRRVATEVAPASVPDVSVDKGDDVKVANAK